jgi:hypothetical protein
MRPFRYFMIVASTFACGGSAFAATVTTIEGRVQVNAGTGFHQIPRSTQVAPGGSVMAGPGGKGEIIYSDGCRVLVNPGSVVVVSRESPCSQGLTPTEPLYMGLGAALAAAGGVIGIAASVRPAPNPASP